MIISKKYFFSFLIIGGLIFFGAFYIYPRWNNYIRFNSAINDFAKTDSIKFTEFNELATKNFDEANYFLGVFYQRSDDSINAKTSFEKALKTNKRIPALYALLNVNPNDSSSYIKYISEEFQDWLLQIKEKDGISQKIAAQIFSYGVGKILDSTKAKEYYEKSIKNGCVVCKVLLGDLLSNDVEDLKHEKKLELYKSAVNDGYLNAMASIGFLYLDGENYKEAKDWLLKSANNKCVAGEIGLALMFMNGKGVEKNGDSAKYWFDRASSNRIDKSETSLRLKKAAQPLGIMIKALMAMETSSSESSNQSEGNNSRTNKSATNKYISCNYCGRGFYQEQGFVKEYMSRGCAISWSKELLMLAVAYNAGYPKENIQYLYNTFENGDWFCTRKCVYESGNCVKNE